MRAHLEAFPLVAVDPPHALTPSLRIETFIPESLISFQDTGEYFLYVDNTSLPSIGYLLRNGSSYGASIIR